MAVWEADAVHTHPVGFDIASTGFVNKVWSVTVLAQTVATLSTSGYRVVHLDADAWRSIDDFHDAIAGGLAFPDYYGRTLDALNDCLGDVAEQAYGWESSDAGLVIVVHGFDLFHHRDPITASALSRLCQSAGQYAALFGHRMLTLLKVEDGNFTFEPAGLLPVPWIAAEFLDSARTRSSR